MTSERPLAEQLAHEVLRDPSTHGWLAPLAREYLNATATFNVSVDAVAKRLYRDLVRPSGAKWEDYRSVAMEILSDLAAEPVLAPDVEDLRPGAVNYVPAP